MYHIIRHKGEERGTGARVLVLVVYHLQQLSGNSGWKVNGT